MELVKINSQPVGERDLDRAAEPLEADPLVKYAVLDSLANVLCPACKLWNTGHGANMMREAVSLMGGYGVTEDCPGFLGQKWMDAQLEATYERYEAVQRLQLSITMTNDLFLAQFEQWIVDMRKLAGYTARHRRARARPTPCASGSGRSTMSKPPPTPTARSSIIRRARV